ncbi:MAG: Asp-tRNA(Asn)/Glu-tRNA(Gln) amidotransferase subunit GatB [Planctomycetota bacterium]|jgi:aspartyl-tRNA(Asn)/glutamyl-tRNA(Gln) amidotransferase subunit B
MQIARTSLLVGMEIHVELATRAKLFTRTPNVAHPDAGAAAPNTLVDPVVAALPGTLPRINRGAVEMSMRVGHALGCTIAQRTSWDRKNYFYPDLPKGYQITQFDEPICTGGAMEVDLPDGTTTTVRLVRAHLEEDTGKLAHELPGGSPCAGSLLDLNRAGTPLLEIVSEPDMTSVETALAYARGMHNLCRFLGVTEGIMQRGHMRFEPNINVVIETNDGGRHATPIVEVKNLNSFRALRGAIEHELERQVTQWQADGLVQGPGMKTTRGWDEQAGATVLQRAKEDAHDYRYFPEPDLVPLVIDEAWRARVAEAMPELPRARRHRFEGALGVAAKDASLLTADRDLCLFFEACLAAGAVEPSACAKLLLNAGSKRANEQGVAIADLGITPSQVAGLLALRQSGDLGSNAADALFGLLCDSRASAQSVAEAHDLLQERDGGQLEAWITEAIEAHPQAAADFAAGKDAAAGRLVGEVMRRSRGRADAAAARITLERRLR